MEPKQNVIDYLRRFLDSSIQSDGPNEQINPESFFTKDFQDRIQKDSQTKQEYNKFSNILRRYVDDYSIIEDTFFQDECNYRIDIKFPSVIEMIGDKYYRFILSSCEGVGDESSTLKIDNISYITDLDNTRSLDKLICIMVMDKMCIGSIELAKESITYKIKVSGSLNKLDKYKNKTLGLHIHTQGDISDDCKKCGFHYNPTLQFHGDVSGERHLGDLGNIQIDSEGNSQFVIYITSFPFPNDLLLYNFVGRSIVLHDSTDDLGQGKNLDSVKTGNSGNRVACGVLGGIYV